MRFYTSSHVLSEVTCCQHFYTTAVNVTQKNSIQLESRRGLFQKTHLLPTGQTWTETITNPNDSCTGYTGLDPKKGRYEDTQNWALARSRCHQSKLADFDRLREATALCYAASSVPERRQRLANIEQAVAMSPNYCAVAHFLTFEMFWEDSNTSNRNTAEAVAILQKAVEAGRNTAVMIRADEFCKGQFYKWMPTRWLVRSIYILGVVLLLADRYDEAEAAFKECLAMDIDDHLGARHKQLLAVLERDGVNGSENEVQWLLSAKFGAAQIIDDTYALFNYTRALRAFAVRGSGKKSTKLLEFAMKKNPHVPKVLLGWEGIKTGDKTMTLGTEMEAGDYMVDNGKHWGKVEGALDWLQQIHCKLNDVEPLTPNSEIRQLLLEARMLIHDSKEALHSPAPKRRKKQAMGKLERIEELLQTQENNARPGSRHKELKTKLYQGKGLCHYELNDFAAALPCFNTALSLCSDSGNKDLIKELMYNRANCKQQSGDLAGALADFTFVYQRIGSFSTAVEGIRTLEQQLLVTQSVLPPPTPSPDVGVDGDDGIWDDLLKVMPTINLQDKLDGERCSHCQRGGMKLALCSACKEAKFCSKQCQVSAWKAYHKFVCEGSKKRLEEGTIVTIQGLEKATQHNGKSAVVIKYLPAKKRFAFKIFESDEGGEDIVVSLRPQSLIKED